MLSNAYFLAKFRFDTAENEPAKNLQNLRKFKICQIFANLLLTSAVPRLRARGRRRRGARGGARAVPEPRGAGPAGEQGRAARGGRGPRGRDGNEPESRF